MLTDAAHWLLLCCVCCVLDPFSPPPSRPLLQADAAAAAVNQRDANAAWEAVAGEFGPVLAAYREMLGGNEEVTLFCAKRVIKRAWEQAYLNRVRVAPGGGGGVQRVCEHAVWPGGFGARVLLCSDA